MNAGLLVLINTVHTINFIKLFSIVLYIMPNKWIQHVKDYAKQHGLSYKDAMSQAKSSYKPSAVVAKKKNHAKRKQ